MNPDSSFFLQFFTISVGKAVLPVLFLLLLSAATNSDGRKDSAGGAIRFPLEASRFFSPNDEPVGTRWAVLIAGSNGYWNNRHQQADIYHAYQLLKKGGLKEKNIIVFMFDDIASNEESPRHGVIINSPHNDDVYKGVPKDYTRENITVNNLFAAILGNKTALTGGNGKVVDSGPDDHIFIYYPGGGGMPTFPNMHVNDLIDVLKKKHALGTYKSLVLYLEACESKSIFEGLLPEDLNIYTTTATTYCPRENPSSPPEYDLDGMEDSGIHNWPTKTSHQLHERYIGTNSANDDFAFEDENSLLSPLRVVSQHDAELLHFWYKYLQAPEDSVRKVEAQKEFVAAMSHRMHLDHSMSLVGKLLFGIEKGPEVLKAIRPAGQPIVDDWDCLKKMVRIFEAHCGSLSGYGMKHMGSLANICNAGIQIEQMNKALAEACPVVPFGKAVLPVLFLLLLSAATNSDGRRDSVGGAIRFPLEASRYQYIGTNSANDDFAFEDENSLLSPLRVVSQHDAELLHFLHKYLQAPEDSVRKVEAQKEFVAAMSHRMHLDHSMSLVGKLLFGIEKGPEVLKAIRPAGQPIVDDWDCLKKMVRIFEAHCGSLSGYSMKHMGSLANICNAGIQIEQMNKASAEACTVVPFGSWRSLH
ncbi:unnamed protein product [Cuscuta campestris]|uniref:Legumain prodomain domain-containing protein n=1 Tax=Cuscuta campestris TaxID=132261 RepID=A0A484NJZ6_9ASTE|nr:unnamed protein product [Cuscuta campestris]